MAPPAAAGAEQQQQQHQCSSGRRCKRCGDDASSLLRQKAPGPLVRANGSYRLMHAEQVYSLASAQQRDRVLERSRVFFLVKTGKAGDDSDDLHASFSPSLLSPHHRHHHHSSSPFRNRPILRVRLSAAAASSAPAAPAAEEGLGPRSDAFGRPRRRRRPYVDRLASACRRRPQPDRAGAVRAPRFQYVADAPPVRNWEEFRGFWGKREKERGEHFPQSSSAANSKTQKKKKKKKIHVNPTPAR